MNVAFCPLSFCYLWQVLFHKYFYVRNTPAILLQYDIIFVSLTVELSVDGAGCKDNLAVDDNQYFILATFSKYGSLDGKGFRLNCTEENAEDISVVAVRIGHISTLAYIPSEKSSDSIRQVCICIFFKKRNCNLISISNEDWLISVSPFLQKALKFLVFF